MKKEHDKLKKMDVYSSDGFFWVESFKKEFYPVLSRVLMKMIWKN
jgi:hypothetical protein